MKILLSVVWLAHLFGTIVSAFAMGGCGPGTGGVPLVDISSHLSAHERIIKTNAGVKEFVLWEKTGQVAYRNAEDKIAATDLVSGVTKLLGNGGVPLAHLLDPSNRFLLGAGTPWEFDSLNHGWYQFAPAAANLKPLFWQNGYLFSARIFWDGRIQRVEIYAYLPEVGVSQRVCPNLAGFGGNTQPVHLAEGSRFPNIYFYTQVYNQMGNNLGMGRIDITQCELAELNHYPYVFYGPIESVHIYDRLHSFSVKVNHPSYNLLWQSGYGSCNYYNIDNLQPLVLSESQPLIATFSSRGGLKIVDLNRQTQATVLRHLPITSISDNDLWLTHDGKRLYAAPELAGQSSRLLFELDLQMKGAKKKP